MPTKHPGDGRRAPVAWVVEVALDRSLGRTMVKSRVALEAEATLPTKPRELHDHYNPSTQPVHQTRGTPTRMAEQTPSRIAALEEVPLREVWRDEAAEFTPWLADNPEHLAKALQMDLELEGTEVAVGPFSADVVLRDTSTGQLVVVENLLEATDHDHLGKLITYAAGLEAKWAVLVARSFRPEHRSALIWLNSIAGEDSGFFGVEVRAVRIGDCEERAVDLKVVVEPDDFSRQARSSSRPMSEADALYLDWWADFLPVFQETHPDWINSRTPNKRNYMVFPSGRSGIRYRLSFAWLTGATNQSLRAEVYMDDGAAIYHQLEAKRLSIESATQLTLKWEPLEGARASRVAVYLHSVDSEDRASWARYRDWSIETLGELRRVFSDPIDELT